MKEMASLSGLSYRQLAYWRERGIFTPRTGTRTPSMGVPHDYDPADLLPARLLARVSKAFEGKVPESIVRAVVNGSRYHDTFTGLEVNLGHGVSLRIVSSAG